jgi:hypothetical protein
MENLTSIIFDFKIWVTITLGILVNMIVSHTPGLVRSYWKSRRLKKLRKIRKARLNPVEVAHEISRANSYFIFFLLTCLIYLLLLVIGPLGDIAEKNQLVAFIFTSPIYVVEIVWLLQDKYVKQLVRASRCVHVRAKGTF